MQRRQRRAEAGDICLPLDADVEKPRVEADRHRKAGEDEARRVVKREANALEVAERAGDEDLHRLERVLADRQNDEAGNHEGGGDVDERDQREVGPCRQGLDRRTHAARSLTPAMSRPRSWGLVSSALRSPVTRPPQSTMMRSESAKISSSSTDTSSTAFPASRRAMIRL